MNDTDVLRVSIERTDILMKSETEILNFPALFSFDDTLVLACSLT